MTARPALAVLGAGTMGHGIAQVAAMAGYDTRLFDVMPDVLETARERIEANLRQGIQRGKVTPEERGRALEGLSYSRYLGEAADGVGIAIEAVPERLDLKQKVLARCGEAAADGALLATNTSSLSITALAEGLPSPGRVIGMHFFNPVPLMKLVAIIRAMQTSDATFESAKALADRLGKTAVAVADSPGFVVNRMLVPMINEAVFAYAEGPASAEELDLAMQLGLSHPIGPLRLADLIGLDVCLYVMDVMYREFCDSKYRPCPLLRKMVDAGRLGRKSGRGFYEYG